MSFIQSLWQPGIKDYVAFRRNISIGYQVKTVRAGFIPYDGAGNLMASAFVDFMHPAEVRCCVHGLLIWEIESVGPQKLMPGCIQAHGSINFPWNAPSATMLFGSRGTFHAPVTSDELVGRNSFSLWQCETQSHFGQELNIHVNTSKMFN